VVSVFVVPLAGRSVLINGMEVFLKIIPNRYVT
jgi:hypothetical protein